MKKLKTKKILALLLAGTMTLSMAACGDKDQEATKPAEGTKQESKQETKQETGEKPSEEKPVAGEASIDFEDGNIGFLAPYTMPANADSCELSIVDYNGSKALQVKNMDGKVPYLAIDINSLLGADIAKIASVEMLMGTSYDNGNFSASSGKITSWCGESQTEVTDEWSVYMERKNPKVAVATVDAGEEFVADADNIIMVSMNTDNGIDEGNGNATLYIDDIRFLDASGNVLKADTSVAFAAPKGFINEGRDINLCYVDNAVEIEGYAPKEAAWTQMGLGEVTDAMKEALVPGAVIEINYNATEPVWLVAVSDGNPKGDWIRVGTDENNDYLCLGNVSSDNTVVQYTYEQLEASLGKNFTETLTDLQCESKVDWEVYGMKIGQKSDFVSLGAKAEVEGFEVSEAAWTQKGIELTDEQKALFVPGSIIEIEYKADEPVWLVAVSDGNPKGDWVRVGTDEGNDYACLGSVSDGKVQFTYELLEEALGKDFLSTLVQLQGESKVDWEIYKLSVGKPIKPAKQATSLEGFAVSEAAWTQKGVDLTDEMKALFVPGSVINVSYKADEPVWLVAVSDGNPKGDWIRVGTDENNDYANLGAYTDGFVQYTYEQLAEALGDKFIDTLVTLQCESKVDWEVYSVAIGNAE